MKSLQSFDLRSLQKYFSPQATSDLNHFLEKLPVNAGQTMLIIAGIIWAVAGTIGLYASVQIQELTKLRAEFQEAHAIQPAVPQIRDVPVDQAGIKEFASKINDVYKGLEIKSSGASISIQGKSTQAFGEFREAIGHIQNGGSGWRVNIDNLCVGRECQGPPLMATLKINKVSVDKPR